MATEDPTLTTCGRSFTYPMCYAAEKAIPKSPFSLRKEDGVKLASSDGFQIIRKLLANQQESRYVSSSQCAIRFTKMLTRHVVQILRKPPAIFPSGRRSLASSPRHYTCSNTPYTPNIQASFANSFLLSLQSRRCLRPRACLPR